MNKFLLALAAGAALVLPLTAQAAVQGSLGTDTSYAIQTLSSSGLSGSPSFVTGGSVLTGSQLGLTQPSGASNYLGAGPAVGNPSTITFTGIGVGYASFLWGTPDVYNSLIVTTVTNGIRATQTFTAVSLGLIAPGVVGGAQGYVQFLASGGSQITALTFDSATANAFEAANFRAGNPTVAVPGPIAGAGIPALLAVAGAFFMRRRRTAA